MEASCSLSSLIQHRPEMQQRQPMEHRAWRAEEAISVQREDIMWLMYNSVSHGWRCTWLERRDSMRERDAHKEQSVISILHGLHSELKASSKILSIKLPTYSFKLYLNENEDHYCTSQFNSLVSLLLPLSESPPSLSPSSLISLRRYLHANDFCVSAFLFFRLLFTCQWLSLLDGAALKWK